MARGIAGGARPRSWPVHRQRPGPSSPRSPSARRAGPQQRSPNSAPRPPSSDSRGAVVLLGPQRPGHHAPGGDDGALSPESKGHPAVRGPTVHPITLSPPSPPPPGAVAVAAAQASKVQVRVHWRPAAMARASGCRRQPLLTGCHWPGRASESVAGELDPWLAVSGSMGDRGEGAVRRPAAHALELHLAHRAPKVAMLANDTIDSKAPGLGAAHAQAHGLPVAASASTARACLQTARACAQAAGGQGWQGAEGALVSGQRPLSAPQAARPAGGCQCPPSPQTRDGGPPSRSPSRLRRHQGGGAELMGWSGGGGFTMRRPGGGRRGAGQSGSYRPTRAGAGTGLSFLRRLRAG